MAWIESHQSLLDHRKTLRFARELELDQVMAIGHLHCFWWWCLDNAPTGRLTVIPTDDIATGSRYKGDPQLFFNALLSAGFINRKGRGVCIHDWYDYAGKLIERRKRNTEAKREARKEGASSGHPNDGASPSAPNPKLPYPTVPNPTVPNPTDLTPLSPPKGGRRRRRRNDTGPLSGKHRDKVQH